MNSVRSKEDHIIGISKSVFVTNFLDYFGSQDLWSLCEAYGKVVDVFIPNRKSKAGKRFAFVRFIRVDDLDRLIKNLCTLWVGRLHLQANAVRYERSLKSFSSARPPNVKVSSSAKVNVIPSSNCHFPSSFVAVVNDKQGFPALNSIDPPALVLDDDCVIKEDLSRSVLGKVKVLSSIANLYIILNKEGFADLQISYLGGSWVRIDLASDKSKNKLLLHKGVLSWFDVLKAATNDFVSSERIVWVDIEGIPLYLWLNATFSKISKKWGDVVDIKESVEEDYNSVDDSVLGDHNNMADILHGHDGKGGGQESEDEWSDDPFGLNDLLDKPLISRVNELDPFLSHPPGFTPDPSQQVHRDSSPIQHNVNPVESLHKESSSPLSKAEVNCHANEDHSVDFSSEESTHIHSRITAKGGSFLDVLDDMIKETVVLGDFNEVRSEEERFGSILNQSCARDFNCFISSSGLVDVKMEGFSFTWVHPSAKKMSKFDRFLVSDGIILGFPAITAVCLDRHLSDHRPILLNEIHTDFGPTLFCTFHSWFSREGFDAMMEQAWSSFTYNDSNSKDAVQKAKVKWAIEGDENSKFFHRIINKRRSQLAIRGVFVNRDWHTEPSLVKDTFLDHFSNRFKQPFSARFKLSLPFPSRLSSDQVLDLDRNISSDEIRAAV
nr:hypothetical protein [Tanacetum cinerariifolium]